MVSMLDDIVRKLSRRVRAYKEVVKRYGSISLLYGVVGFMLWQVVAEKPKAAERVNVAREKGMEIVKTNEDTIYTEERKYNIQALNTETGKKEDIFNPVKHMNYYRLLFLATYAHIALRQYDMSKKKRLKAITDKNERVANISSIIGASTGAAVAIQPIIKYMKIIPKCETTAMFATLLSVAGKELHEKHLYSKRYKQAENEGDLENPFYLRGVAKELREKSLKALKKNKLEEACILLLEQREILRKYHQQVDLWEEGIVMYDFKHFFYRLKAMTSRSFEDELRLLLKTPVEMHELKTLDLENGIRRNPKKEIELRLLDFEFETDDARRREKGKALYEILSERGMVESMDKGKNSVVSAMSCSTLGRQYVIKRNKDNRIDGEIRQTQDVKEGFRGDNEVVIPDIVIKYDGREIPELKDDAIMFMRYLEGEVMTEKLRKMIVREQVELLKRAARVNMKSSGYGIIEKEEDRYVKAIDDIRGNSKLDKEVKNVLEDNIKVCFKFADYFSSVYDRDGHPDNILVSNGNLVLLDFEIRQKSDPIYMVVKLLEYKGVLGYDGQGMDAREEVVNEHLSNMGSEERGVGLPHYLASIPLKALSFHRFSAGREDCEGIRQGYLKSSIFGLEMISNRFSGFYKDDELKKLDNIRKVLEGLKT